MSRVWIPTATRFVPDTKQATTDEVYEPEHDPVWPHMTKEYFMRIGAYIRNVANQIGLRDWALNLSWEPITDGEDCEAMASVSATYGQRLATIRLMADFALLPASHQTHALVHELYHLHLDHIEFLARGCLADCMGASAYDMYRSVLRREIENATDAIAIGVAELLPRIDSDWDKEQTDD